MKKTLATASIFAFLGLSLSLSADSLKRLEDSSFQENKQLLLKQYAENRAEFETSRQQLANLKKQEERIAFLKEQLDKLKKEEAQKKQDLALKIAFLKQHQQEITNVKITLQKELE